MITTYTKNGRIITGICDFCFNADERDVNIINDEFICDFCIDAFGRIEKGDEE